MEIFEICQLQCNDITIKQNLNELLFNSSAYCNVREEFKQTLKQNFFRCASISRTYPSKSVRRSVGDTFEFPYYQRLWLLYVKS